MRQSLVGGSADLADAARMRPATQLWRGSDTEGTRGGWATPDRQAAAEYGANVRSAGNAPDALEVRDFSDIELAIGDDPAAARALSYLNDSNADVWDALELPEVQSAMRAQGHRAVRLLDDVSPAGRKHESYLFLEPQAQQAGRVPVGRLRPAVQDFPGGQKPVAYTGDNHFFAAEAARAAGARNLDDIGGFVDEAGNYFTREEAASLLGITRRRAGSEDLYPDRTQSDGGPPRPPMFPGGRNR